MTLEISRFKKRDAKKMNNINFNSKPKTDINDAFWRVVDDYDSGALDKEDAYNEFLKINNGNAVKANADMDLMLGTK